MMENSRWGPRKNQDLWGKGNLSGELLPQARATTEFGTLGFICQQWHAV
jgi:hypothetical protein